MKSLLKDTHPNLYKELNISLNNNIDLTKLTSSNPKKVWWTCEKGHEWEMSVSDRTRVRNGRTKGGNCPICSNRKIIQGVNDLTSTHPEIAKEWHPTKNILLVEDVGIGSAKKAWWLCDKGHEWEARIASRQLSSCPYCKGNKVIKNVNDLKTTHPLLFNEIHPTKNVNIISANIKAGSAIQIWWTCENNHEWKATVSSRALAGKGCPYCSNRKVLPGRNDLASQAPHLLKEFNKKLNRGIDPTQIVASSYTKVWWICEKGHEWQTTPAHRFVRNQGCPFCSNQVSTPEKEIYEYLKKLNIEMVTSCRTILPSGKEIDIYCPNEKIGIEFNGLYWHSEQQGKDSLYHYNKWFEAKQQGIQLIQIWEDDWNDKKSLVLKTLIHKLGKDTEPKIYARNTYIKKPTRKEATTFFNLYHIQGDSNYTEQFGLYLEGNLVAVIGVSLKHDNTVLEIVRFACSQPVVGGFSKLLNFLEKTFTTVQKIITFSDHCISDGGLYLNTGFVATRSWKSSRYYAIAGKRVHRLSLTKSKLKKSSLWLYEEGKSETDIARLNNIPIIWDAGKTRWEKETNNFSRLV